MPYIDISGCKLFYEINDYTDPWTTPETVLMVHGFTESTPAWRAWVPHLARHYRVIRFDQQGFGQSSAVPHESAFSTHNFVEHAAKLRQRPNAKYLRPAPIIPVVPMRSSPFNS